MGMKRSSIVKVGKSTKMHGDTKTTSTASGRSRTGKGVRKPEIK